MFKRYVHRDVTKTDHFFEVPGAARTVQGLAAFVNQAKFREHRDIENIEHHMLIMINCEERSKQHVFSEKPGSSKQLKMFLMQSFTDIIFGDADWKLSTDELPYIDEKHLGRIAKLACPEPCPIKHEVIIERDPKVLASLHRQVS